MFEPASDPLLTPGLSPGTATSMTSAFLAAGFMLVSWWKPLVMLLPFLGWGWVVSKVLDKHAARFFLPRQAWGAGHLVAGLVAMLAGLLMPLPGLAGFFAGLGAIVVILAADILAYVLVANKDERVPAEHRLTLDFSKWKQSREAKAAAKKQGKVELVIKQPDKGTFAPPQAETPEFELRVAAEQLLVRALDSRASQVELLPTGNKDGGYGAVMLIDGVKQAGDQMPAANAVKLIDLWKSAAKLDVADRRKKLQDVVNIERGEKKVRVQVTTQGGQAGQRLTLLINPDTAVRRKTEELGLLEPQAAELKELTGANEGVVILAGQSDGGRTTMMYSVVKMHDAYTTNVQTIELDIQDALEGVRQNKWDPQAEGPDFSTLTRSILRRDPDVVAIADLPDQNTAKEIAKADQARTRTYVSVRADNALAALATWIKTIGDPDAGSACLRGVVAVRLVRKLCTNCRVPYQPAPDMLKKLGLPADKVKQLYKKGGQVIIKKDPETCPVCQGLGYVGQEGCWEVYKVGQPERDLIKAGSWPALKSELRKRPLPTIQMAALRKAVDGITSVEEILRVTAEAPPAGGGAPPSGSAPKPAAPASPAAGAKPPAQPPKPAVTAPAKPPAKA